MRTMTLALAALIAAGPASAQDGKVSDKAIRQAVKDEDRKGLDAAVRDLVIANSSDAMRILLAQAVKPAGPDKLTGREDVWWMETYMTILNGAASFTDPAALGELATFIVKNSGKPTARDAMAMVCNHGQKALLALCLKVLEAGAEDLKIMAVDHLIAIGDKTVVEPLIKALKANEKSAGDLKIRLGRALTVLTGQDYGDSVSNWLGWWDANKDKDWDVKGSEGGSTGTVTDGLDRSRHSEFEKLKKTGKLLVLQAGDKCKCGKNHDLDNIDRITSKMGLTTETIDKVEFETKNLKLEEYVAILANCTHIREHCTCPQCKPSKNYTGNRLFQCECPINKHDPYAYVLGEKGVSKIKKYVEGGGYLFAEDWCMEDFLGKAFGDYVTHGSIRSEDETVPVLPKAGAASHPYLRKIFFKPPAETRDTLTESDLEKIAHVWKIDKETRTIRVKDPKKVVTLLTSPHLEKYAQGDDAVAVTFEVSPDSARKAPPATATGPEISQDRRKMAGGRVLYVLSHFGKQESQKDEYALQNLLINFLVEANERRGTYAPPPSAKKK